MRFTRAIVRPPAATFAAGITTSGLGPPDLAVALEQHEAYCRTLERLGLSLSRLAPDPEFPDSTFVEDAAIATSRGAILTRPGAASRAGEVASLGAALGQWFPELDRIGAPGTVDGGDVCEAGDHFFIWVSDRTNAQTTDVVPLPANKSSTVSPGLVAIATSRSIKPIGFCAG